MKINRKLKKGSGGPLFIVVILIIVIIIIFFVSGYLAGFLPDGLPKTGSEDQDAQDSEVVDKNIDLVTVSQGVYSKYSESGGLIIENADNFKTLWSQTSGGQAPDIDFENRVVLAAFSGDEPTGGYSIQITNVMLENDKLVANVTLTTPGRNCAVASSVTNPYHIVSIERKDLPIEFVSYDKVENCD